MELYRETVRNSIWHAQVESLFGMSCKILPVTDILLSHEHMRARVLHGPPSLLPVLRDAHVPEVAHLHLEVNDDNLLATAFQSALCVDPPYAED